MDELGDEVYSTIGAYSFPGEVFSGIVKTIISSDASDTEQKMKRATAAHKLKIKVSGLRLEHKDSISRPLNRGIKL